MSIHVLDEKFETLPQGQTTDVVADAHTNIGEMETNIGQVEGEDLSAYEHEQINKIKERKLLLKLDLHFVPVIMLVYLSCFLDRSNAGNVKVAGLTKDIHATDSQFSTAISIFYATYVAFETPAAILMKRLQPRNILTTLCVIWSLTTICTGFISNIGGLYATRLILGFCEAGVFPCLNLYLTMVYRREEQAKRVSYLFSCAALSGAFGGLLAYALLLMDGVQGLAGWRWVYIIEGLFSIVVGVVVWFGLPNDPGNAYFLNEEEKHMMKVRYAQTRRYMGSNQFSWKEIRLAMTDPKLYMSGVIQFCQDILLYGFSTFLPSILKTMGYSSLQSNYLTIPVYIWGAVAFVTIAFFSDRTGRVGPFLIFINLFGITGYVLLLTVHSNAIKYFATFLCAVAVYNGPGLNLTWLNVNVAPHYRRATAIGFQQTMGNTAGIIAGQIYRRSPYKLGHAFSLGAICFAECVIVANMVYLTWCNRLKQKIWDGEVVDERKKTTGDREVLFKYHI